MDTDVSTSSPSARGTGRIARRRDLDTGPTATITSMFPADPPPPPPAPTGPVPVVHAPHRVRGVVPVLLAAALVLALAASVGVGVLWSANRKLAAEVDAALAQAAITQQQLVDLRGTTPDAAVVDVLTDRVQDVEEWTGLPDGGQGRAKDLQTRLADVRGDTDQLQHDVRDGLADVRASVTALQGAVAGASDAATSDDLDALQEQVQELSTDVATLCWALAYQPGVAASC
ncbi:hypothetical protein [Isoptericola jiangsuensis]|nr:hypothetical protein [Isoptericola jiangsuensis]